MSKMKDAAVQQALYRHDTHLKPINMQQQQKTNREIKICKRVTTVTTISELITIAMCALLAKLTAPVFCYINFCYWF